MDQLLNIDYCILIICLKCLSDRISNRGHTSEYMDVRVPVLTIKNNY